MTIYEKVMLTIWLLAIMLFIFGVIVGFITDFGKFSLILLNSILWLVCAWFVAVLPVILPKIWMG